MSIITKILGGSIGKVIDSLAGVADRFINTADEKAAFRLEAAKIIEARDSELEETLRTEMQAKERVLVAELQQGDKFTKRARPSLVYSGLVFAFLEVSVRVYLTIRGLGMPEGMDTIVPVQFWAAWTGVTGTWVIGRSVERRGVQNKIVSLITGNK